MYKHTFRDYLIPRKASASLDLLPVCIFHRNVLYSCPRVRRAHTLCPWGVDLSLGSRGLWSEWRALIFKHVLLRERGGKWFMIYTVVSQLRRSTLRKDSMIPRCFCALLSSRSYRVQLSSRMRSPRTMSFSWLFHSRLSIILFHDHPAEWRPVCWLRCLRPYPSAPRLQKHSSSSHPVDCELHNSSVFP